VLDLAYCELAINCERDPDGVDRFFERFLNRFDSGRTQTNNAIIHIDQMDER
jgi:hypothetical protein